MYFSVFIAFLACLAGGLIVLPMIAAASGVGNLSAAVLAITFAMMVVLAMIGTLIEQASVVCAALVYWGIRLAFDRWKG